MEFPHDVSSYELLHPIGRGPYDSVYVARCLTNEKLVAVKIYDMEEIPADFDRLREGISFWATSTCSAMIKYYGSFVSGSKLWVLTEFMDGGSVLDILRYQASSWNSDEILVSSILEPVIRFLVYFHEGMQIHRDIQPSNILINSEGESKVGDLEMSCGLIQAGQRQRARYTVVGASVYMAPEVLSGQGYTEKADIWSLGITAIELITGKIPFSDMSPLEQVKTIIQGNLPRIPQEIKVSSAFQQFVNACLIQDPELRPLAKDLLRCSFIKQSKGSEYISSVLMSNMPPLYQRYEYISPNIKEKESSRKQEINFFFDEGEAPETHVEVEAKKEDKGVVQTFGRFTVTIRQPKKPKNDINPSESIESNPKNGKKEIDTQQANQTDGQTPIPINESKKLPTSTSNLSIQVQAPTNLTKLVHELEAKLNVLETSQQKTISDIMAVKEQISSLLSSKKPK